MPKVKNQKQPDDSGLNFEAQLWAAADKMRGHMDASEYKHVVLGLSFRTDLHPDLKADFILVTATHRCAENKCGELAVRFEHQATLPYRQIQNLRQTRDLLLSGQVNLNEG